MVPSVGILPNLGRDATIAIYLLDFLVVVFFEMAMRVLQLEYEGH